MRDKLLAAFITAAERGSFAKAAESMLLTSASVMNQINALETEVGAQLFERAAQFAPGDAQSRTADGNGAGRLGFDINQ